MLKLSNPASMQAGLIAILTLLFINGYSQTKDPGPLIGNTGKVTFTYLGKPVTYATVRAADSNIWLQQNLGSIRVALSQDDKQSYGDLFQWGRWDDGHQVREPIFSAHKSASPNNPMGLNLKGKNPFLYDAWLNSWWARGKENDSWAAATTDDVTANNGCDPCKALGAGWRLPTIEEWEVVAKMEDITDISSAMRSNLKLPLSGSRADNGVTITGERSWGSYWTNQPYKTGYASFLHLTIQGIAFDKVVPRGSAQSIRCIKSKNIN